MHIRLSILGIFGVALLAVAVVHAQPATTLTSCLTRTTTDPERNACVAMFDAETCARPAAAPAFDLRECIASMQTGSGRQMPENNSRLSRECRVKQREYEQADQKRSEDVVQACRAGVRGQVDAFLDAETSCIDFGKISDCARLPVEVFQTCVTRCISTRELKRDETVEQEQSSCESRFVEKGGHGNFACSIPGALSEVDAAKTQSEFNGAMQAHDGPALDATLKRADGSFLAKSQQTCTKACNERGPNLLAVRKQGPELVNAYKRCMMTADSTREARKLDAYEADLYCGYVQRADAKCRTADRCDWVEQYSNMVCNYASQGADRCR